MEAQDHFGPGGADSNSISLSLLERIRAQDAVAWRRLVDLYTPLVRAWFQRRGVVGEDAEDLLQDVFKAVASNIAGFRRQRPGDTFRGWLYVIARNQVRLYFRRRARQPQAAGGTAAQIRLQELPDDNEDDADASDAQDARELFHRALKLIRSEFENSTWQAFWLLVVEGRPSEDVCREFHLTRGALRQAKWKVLRRLRAELGGVLE